MQKKGKGRRCCLGDRIFSIPCLASYLHYRTSLKNRILQIILVLLILFFKSCKTARGAKELLNKFCPPNSSDDFCLFFSIYPSSMMRIASRNVYVQYCRFYHCCRVSQGFSVLLGLFVFWLY